MSRRFPQEVHDFIAANVLGNSCKELTKLVNEKFGKELFTPASMKSYKSNHNLQSHTPRHIAGLPTKRYPKEIGDYIAANCKGTGPKEMAQRLNEKFGTNYTMQQICSYYKNHHLSSGLSGRFVKGQQSPNKGRKGYHAPGAEKTWFHKGHVPANKLPVGSLVVKTDGYLWRKIGEGKRQWKQEHRIVWERLHGKIPKGYLVTFLDGDRMNVAPENLALISKAEHAQMIARELRSSNPKITETGILIAKIHTAANKRKKGEKKRWQAADPAELKSDLSE